MLDICKLACALMLMFNALLGPALNARAVISSTPDTVAVIDNAWLDVAAEIVIKKSINPLPQIVFIIDEFDVIPETRPLNDAITLVAFAFVAGLVNDTRSTNDMPAT